MNKIITISRQFGSGGREVGKRLADSLGCAYYDKELIKEVAKKSGLHEEYVEKYSESNFTRTYPFTCGRSFITYQESPSDKIQLLQIEIIKELAKKNDCVIIGHLADYILSEDKPFKVFIYSSEIESRMNRCYVKVIEEQDKSKKEMEKMILNIDKQRAKYYAFYTGQTWGNMPNYNLCIDTSVVDIKKAVELIILATIKN